MRIQAGNTLLSQYVPPFVIDGQLRQGQILEWDNCLKAFKNVNRVEDADGLLVEGIFSALATGNDVQTIFPIPWEAPSEDSLIVTINGVRQHTTSYSVSVVGIGVSNVVFTEAPDDGDSIEFIGLVVNNPDDIFTFSTVGDGIFSSFTIPWATSNAASLIITINGVKQQTSTYNVMAMGNSSVVNLGAVVDAGDAIEVIGISSIGTTLDTIVDGNNLGGALGVGIYATKTTAGQVQTLNFRSLIAGAGINLTQTTDFISIESLLSYDNVGSGAEVLVDGSANDIEFRSLVAGAGIGITQNTDEIEIAFTGDATSIDGLDADDLAQTLIGQGIGESLVLKGTASPDGTFIIRNVRGINGVSLATVGDDLVISGSPAGYIKVSADFTVPSDVGIVGVNNNNPVVITIPPASSVGVTSRLLIKDERGLAGAQTITVQAQAGDTIDGFTSIDIDNAYGSLDLYSDSDNWFIVTNPPLTAKPLGIYTFSAVADGFTNQWVMPFVEFSAANMYVTVDGVKLQAPEYSISVSGFTTTIVLATTPASASLVEVVSYTGSANNAFNAELFTGDGIIEEFNIAWGVNMPEEVFVTIDGVKLPSDEYTVDNNGSDSDVTFNVAPPVGTQIEFVGPNMNVTTLSFEAFIQAGDNISTSWVLPWVVSNPAELIASIDGIKLPLSGYTLTPNTASSTIFSLAAPIGVASNLEVIGIVGF